MAAYSFIEPTNCRLVYCTDAVCKITPDAAHDLEHRARSFASEVKIPFQMTQPRMHQCGSTAWTRDEISDAAMVLVAGSLLESAVTRFCLSSLLEGFDVFLLVDLTATAEPQYQGVFLDRIRRRGGDVVTSSQAKLELRSALNTN